jgi:cell division protein FtsL
LNSFVTPLSKFNALTLFCKADIAMRRLPLNQPNFTVRRERDTRALVRLASLLFCGLVLSGGFVYAAGQRFAAVRYGYQSEELRRERARLIEEQRRLLLERERASSPARLENVARELGLQPIQPAQVETARNEKGATPPTATAFISASATLKR